jgi:hypothetical protein
VKGLPHHQKWCRYRRQGSGPGDGDHRRRFRPTDVFSGFQGIGH